ncbi:MAG: GNAT family N-acetyltransferase [Clostridia bacterium]|nr:GNAT family N-acetyltransferase [Clostridia bacterium]
MSINLTFRPMTPSDEDEIRRFYADMGEESAAFFNVNHGNEHRTLEFFENGKPDHRFFVAADGDRIAGLVFIWDIDRALPWLGIAVRDDYQGRGVGTFLLRALFDLLNDRGHGGLILRTAKNNTGAQRLYEKTGFERMGEHPSGELLYIKRFAAGEPLV